ncbi:MAG: Spo0E family sporulation regulatory protein-aspartic acid phosphatase [Clostridia bacterium]|nr:Spo0E family sporulation regulatory protein-aspartic acid phosphatase [Clostridia bacterium]
MANEGIDTLRRKLDKLIENAAPYEEIYKVSTELDQYIVKYYQD